MYYYKHHEKSTSNFYNHFSDKPFMRFTDEKITETTEQKNMELFKKTNFGLTAGASYTFLKNFCFEARYYFGLSNIYNEDNLPKTPNAVTTANAKNHAFQIGLAYMFNLKKM
ncbi:PorT family protein [Paenimyroides aestuarii]|uniref:PorT family protein n=2 Tax=Paenimyroides aestuarii TaxID=2968490 RepID=A0ABY5NW43_9FLAO|nr:PorT family protein [Paenimyroides aestuarii]UUV22838.1 PorT family protein [Paenimyroides aestuarii]